MTTQNPAQDVSDAAIAQFVREFASGYRFQSYAMKEAAEHIMARARELQQAQAVGEPTPCPVCLGFCGDSGQTCEERFAAQQVCLPYGIIDPDYARIFTIARVLAWSEGYALTMHGSFTRDLDLVAVPWTDKAREPEHLARRVLETCGLKDTASNPGIKPHGRLVWTMRLPDFGDPRFVDFSILSTPQSSATQQAQVVGESGLDDLCQRLSEHGAKSGRRAATKRYNDGVPTHTEMLMGQAVDAIRRLATPQSSAPAVGDDLESKYNVLRNLLQRSWREVHIGTKKYQLTLTVTPEYLERIESALTGRG